MPPKRILLVDDDEPCLRLMEEILTRKGYSVLSTMSREQALSAYERSTDGFDLLITDIVLSGTERGYELAWKLTDRDPHLRVMLVSAHAHTRDDLEAAVPTTRAAFIEKPFSLDAFAGAVQEILR